MDHQEKQDNTLPSTDDEASVISPDDDEDLAEPTLYERCMVSMRGWKNDSEDEARAFGANLLGNAKDLSRLIDLSRLEAIIIAQNYYEGLASVVRDDSQELPAAVPTSNEYSVGGAMAIHVMRGGEPWSVVVIWAGLVEGLLDETHENHQFALQTFVHELIHVDDLRLLTRTYPGGWKAATPTDGREDVMHQLVNPCQSEYSAQRRSAWAHPEGGFAFIDMLRSTLADVDAKIRSARLEYRVHGDMEVYWPIVAERVRFLFQAIGYAVGHADWAIARGPEELAQRYQAALDDLAMLPSGWIVKECQQAVLPIFDQKEWTGLEVYDPLIQIAEKLLNQHGMFTRPSDDGENIYINMPYTGFHDL